jgi:hypothetical protein
MTPEAIENLADQAGKKINDILMRAKRDCDKLLNNMGLQLDLGYELKSKGNSEEIKGNIDG